METARENAATEAIAKQFHRLQDDLDSAKTELEYSEREERSAKVRAQAKHESISKISTQLGELAEAYRKLTGNELRKRDGE